MKNFPVGAVPLSRPVRRTTLAVILTDLHFWIPVVVLFVGLALLVVLS